MKSLSTLARAAGSPRFTILQESTRDQTTHRVSDEMTFERIGRGRRAFRWLINKSSYCENKIAQPFCIFTNVPGGTVAEPLRTLVVVTMNDQRRRRNASGRVPFGIRRLFHPSTVATFSPAFCSTSGSHTSSYSMSGDASPRGRQFGVERRVFDSCITTVLAVVESDSGRRVLRTATHDSHGGSRY